MCRRYRLAGPDQNNRTDAPGRDIGATARIPSRRCCQRRTSTAASSGSIRFSHIRYPPSLALPKRFNVQFFKTTGWSSARIASRSLRAVARRAISPIAMAAAAAKAMRTRAMRIAVSSHEDVDLAKDKDVAFRSDVHVDASGLETIWTIRPEHFDPELGVILANAGHRRSHIEHGFKVALQATLEYSGVAPMPLSIRRPRPPIAM